jgi:hypothetical protein
MEATEFEKEMLKKLKDNNVKLLYGTGDFPLGMEYQNGSAVPCEIFFEIMHISKSVYFSCN